MSQLAGESRCQQCGYALGAGERLMGLCPRCLMARVLDIRREVQIQINRVRPWPDAPDIRALNDALPSLEVMQLIGRGGMGLVYRARQRNLDREVAVKILPADQSSDAAAVARFTGESRILGSLNHPNIVMALDAGQVPGWFYLVMELVDGPNLREVLKRQQRLGVEEAIQVALQVSAALAYAHSRQVVHRDIKPENILLEPAVTPPDGDLAGFFAGGGKVRVADFGVARLLQSAEMTLTAPMQIVGTLDYLAPECRHGSADAAPSADVYAVGVMLYEMLTGHTPAGNFDPPGKVSGGDSRLDALIMRALSANPDERYADGAALHRALAKAAGAQRPRRLTLAIAAAAVLAALGLSVWSFRPARPGEDRSHLPDVSLHVPADTQPAGPDLRVLMPGDPVQTLWEGQWLNATVLEREGRRVKVHYEGWSETLDEWVSADRIRW